jgi:hypothetical protein
MSSLQLAIFFVSAPTMRVAAAVFMPTVSAESGTQHRKVSTTTFLVADILLHLNDRSFVGNSATCTGAPDTGIGNSSETKSKVRD